MRTLHTLDTCRGHMRQQLCDSTLSTVCMFLMHFWTHIVIGACVYGKCRSRASRPPFARQPPRRTDWLRLSGGDCTWWYQPLGLKRQSPGPITSSYHSNSFHLENAGYRGGAANRSRCCFCVFSVFSSWFIGLRLFLYSRYCTLLLKYSTVEENSVFCSFWQMGVNGKGDR